MTQHLALSLLGMIVAQIADAPRANLAAPTPSSPIERLQQWREENKAEFKTRRIAGMKRATDEADKLVCISRLTVAVIPLERN